MLNEVICRCHVPSSLPWFFKTVDANQDTWDSQLPRDYLLIELQFTCKTTGFTYLLAISHAQLPIDVMLDYVLPATLCSYPQFIQDTHKQMAMPESCNIVHCKHSIYLWRKCLTGENFDKFDESKLHCQNFPYQHFTFQ